MDASYPELMRRLAELAAALQNRRNEAQQWYAQRCDGAQAAVAEVETDLAELHQLHEQASRELADVDRAAADIWTEVGHRFGPLAGRLGGLPAPLPPPPGTAVDDDPEHWLAAARALVERSNDVGPLSRAAYPVLALFGAAGAVAAFGLSTAARWAGQRYGGDLAVGMPVIALVVTLVGPLLGLVPAKALADRRHAELDLRTVSIVLVAGLAATAVLLTGLG
ncbi:hypothetical protein [Solwaraspora sp. WMMA2065]|uniref:hypothetical protein n=1 Tax=Solwaraspora sp. WMMA2065 TaxID=3015166 RepID=UPI00259B0356|nr:hypothetical protein [Solwaraspora sp. WMMA2065]WJK35952.1 hypothetical protein O7610_06255 [Solwaraspora sp. WMMA2065]